MTTALSTVDRYRGALLGLAAGDALGTTLEFRAPWTFQPLTDMVGGGPFQLAPGQWTDDTSMALCLAESLVECQGFDPTDQMRRYLRWYREGYLSSTGTCFDIGLTTRAALRRFEQSGEPFAGETSPHAAGNGSLVRLAPRIDAVAAGSFRAKDPPAVPAHWRERLALRERIETLTDGLLALGEAGRCGTP